jgi:DNA invertase Pin-like site-specific DNA recombinase
MVFDPFGEGRTRRPVRCVIYTRQSVGSSDELSSCAIQREACAVFAAAQGWSVVDEAFDDVGFSGATLDRPGLQRLLAFVRQAGADRILIHRLDRLSRNVRDCVGLFDEFRRLNLNLVIVTAPELGHAAQDHFLLNIMASFAEFEREMIAGRIAEARAALTTKARRIAGALPFGFDADPRTKQLVPNPREAEVIRWMFEEAVAGRRPAEIAKTANILRYRTKPNGRWSARQVVATLRNPVYIGKFKDGKGERPGCHERIVDIAVFEAVGRALDSRRTGKPDPTRYGPVWPLKGKVYCCRCGRMLSPHSCRHGMKVYRYYRCRTTSGGRDPCGYQVPANLFERAVDLHFPWRIRRTMTISQLSELVDYIEYDPRRDEFTVYWKKPKP